jgi:hypothetical protein
MLGTTEGCAPNWTRRKSPKKCGETKLGRTSHCGSHSVKTVCRSNRKIPGDPQGLGACQAAQRPLSTGCQGLLKYGESHGPWLATEAKGSIGHNRPTL